MREQRKTKMFVPLLTAVLWVVFAFSSHSGENEGLEFRFSYLPYHDSVRFIVVSPPGEAVSWEIVLFEEGKNDVLAGDSGKFPFERAGRTMEVPALDEGVYSLRLIIKKSEGEMTVLERSFVREELEWENNELGQDRSVIIPPFTPLEVQEQTVSSILRDHSLGESGFWDQVTSQDVELLAEPMQLVVESGGRRYTASGGAIDFEKTSGYQVKGRSSWEAGPLKGSTDIDFDYDGMMKVHLEIEPTEEVIDSMRLVIPMKADEAWLLHPVTDLLRHHYAGRIPEGEGKVWDSSDLPRHQLPGPFVPYIWLGGPERGISFFADNDRDWLIDRSEHAMEIHRRNETVDLSIRFITRPSQIERRRTIVFGLMATPAKPMPEKPVNFRNWWVRASPTDTTTGAFLYFLGSCYNWGAQTPSRQYYPAFKNYSLYDEFVRVKEGGEIDRDYSKREWLPQFDGIEQVGENRRGIYYRHIHNTFHTLRGSYKKKQQNPDENHRFIIPYTNARGVIWDEDTRTFMDEWTIYDVADPRWNTPTPDRFRRFVREDKENYTMFDSFAYGADPVESYVDMALFYIKKMFETFADGVNFDCWFFHANSNPVPGPGYVGDDGELHPGVGLFAFREFARRVAVLQHQMGMRPLVYLHMTNANIVPILSFGTLNLEWEWFDQDRREFGGPDYRVLSLQDRLHRFDVNEGDTSMILTQSTGLQSGNPTVSIDLFSPPAESDVEREWLLRTQVAVCIPHEIKPSGYSGMIFRVQDILTDFGYGKEDCRVYRYWERPFPLKTHGAVIKPLLLSKDGRALVFAGSFGEGGECVLELDWKKLGLSEDAGAVNAETGENIIRTGPGRFVFNIKKHDFQIFLIE